MNINFDLVDDENVMVFVAFKLGVLIGELHNKAYESGNQAYIDQAYKINKAWVEREND